MQFPFCRMCKHHDVARSSGCRKYCDHGSQATCISYDRKDNSKVRVKILEFCDEEPQYKKLNQLLPGQFFMLASGHTPCVVLLNEIGRVSWCYVHKPVTQDLLVHMGHVYAKDLKEARTTSVILLTLEKAEFRQQRPC